MHRFIKIGSITVFLLVLSACFLSGCGSSGGGSSSEVRLSIISPSDDETFEAGDAVSYQIAAANFNLRAPNNHTSTLVKDHPVDQDHMGEDEEHEDLEDDHSHGGDGTNPTATEGHYHVYLNDAEGTDPHLTAWTESGTFMLPADLTAGIHSLRFELRDNDHVRLGTVGSEAAVFFNVE